MNCSISAARQLDGLLQRGDALVAERRPLVAHVEVRRDAAVLQMRITGFRLFRLLGHRGYEVSCFPFTEVFLRQGIDLLGRHVANHQHRVVLRPVPAIKKLHRVLVLVRHIDDVIEITHGGVAVGVGGERGLHEFLIHLLVGAGKVLGVFAFHRACLGFEVVFRVGQVHESI